MCGLSYPPNYHVRLIYRGRESFTLLLYLYGRYAELAIYKPDDENDNRDPKKMRGLAYRQQRAKHYVCERLYEQAYHHDGTLLSRLCWDDVQEVVLHTGANCRYCQLMAP